MSSYPGSDLTFAQLLHALNKKVEDNPSCVRFSIHANFSLEEVINLETSALRVLVGLRTFKNVYSPINRLHPECLALIFELVARDAHNNAEEENTCTSPYKWISEISHVCHYWCDTALSYPSIWSILDSRCPAMAKVCLVRSKSALLDVRISPCCSEDFMRSLVSHAARMYALHISMGRSNQTLLLLLQLLAGGAAPKLKVLDICIPGPGSTGAFPAIFGGYTPTLTHLRLFGFPLGRASGASASLVTLDIAAYFRSPAPTMTELLDVLASNPGLQNIRISSAGPVEDDVNSDKIVTLDHLRYLIIDDSTPKSILSHLSLPCGLQLIIRNRKSSGHGGFMDESLPSTLSRFANIGRIEKLQLLYLPGPTSSAHGIGPTGSILIQQPGIEATSPGHLPNFHVRELWLENIKIGSSSSLAWCTGFPSLETLKIAGPYGDWVSELFRVTGDHVVFPSLRKLVVYARTKWQLPELCSALEDRKSRGFGLERITIIASPDKVIPPAHLTALQQVVKIVRYRVAIDGVGMQWPHTVSNTDLDAVFAN